MSSIKGYRFAYCPHCKRDTSQKLKKNGIFCNRCKDYVKRWDKT